MQGHDLPVQRDGRHHRQGDESLVAKERHDMGHEDQHRRGETRIPVGESLPGNGHQGGHEVVRDLAISDNFVSTFMHARARHRLHHNRRQQQGRAVRGGLTCGALRAPG